MVKSLLKAFGMYYILRKKRKEGKIQKRQEYKQHPERGKPGDGVLK